MKIFMTFSSYQIVFRRLDQGGRNGWRMWRVWKKEIGVGNFGWKT
jgi:hypothetical protein